MARFAAGLAEWLAGGGDLELRGHGDDDGDHVWSVNGRPLVCFHFSGFTPEEPFRLSRFDRRYSVPLLFSVSRLLQEYTERLLRNGWGRFSRLRYGFDRFPSGVPIDERMRRIFKDAESCLRTDIDPFTDEGEEYFCQALLSPLPCYPSLLPAVLHHIRAERPDLQATYPNADVKPEAMIEWFVEHGRREGYCPQLFDRHRPVVPASWLVPQLHRDLWDTLARAGALDSFGSRRAVLWRLGVMARRLGPRGAAQQTRRS